MEALQNIFQAEIIQRLGWTLVHFVWQAAAVCLILAIALRLLHKSPANLRYITACIALALTVLIPVVTLKMIDVPQDTVEPVKQVSVDLPKVRADTQAAVEIPQVESPPPQGDLPPRLPLKNRFTWTIEPALPYIVAAWLLGVFGLSLWHLGGWIQLQRFRRQMVKQVTPALKAKLQHLSNMLGIKKTIAVMESALVQVPSVVGHLKPVILLPASAMTGLSPQQLEAVLAHELAHIKRHDYLINMLQTVIEILGFYHPAIWWISRKIRIERENCCDDLAVSVSGDKIRYARALTIMEQVRADRLGLAVAVSGGSLFNRIRRLLAKDTVRKEKAGWIPSAVAILLITALVIPAGWTLAQQINAKEPSPSEGRIVRFPTDRSMGYLWIQDEGIVNVNSTFDIAPGAPEEEKWQLIGHARGDIVVPPGKRLSLSIPNDKNVWKDLSPLQNIKPNDLYQLWLPGDIGGMTSPIDTCMPHIAHLTGLKDLHLRLSNISNNGLQYIKDFHSLEYLHLPTRIDDSTMNFITRFKSLKGLYFTGTGRVNNDGLAALQQLPNLEEIAFEGEGKITSASLRHLSKIPSLKKLSFFCNTVSDKDFIYLRDMPQLKTLMLQHTNITDSGLQFFSNLHQLEVLDLYDTDVTDAGIQHLVKLKSLRRLEFKKHWNSKKQPITEKAAPYLAQIPTLEYLEFECLAVTDYALSELSKLPNLKTLCANYGRSGESITNIGLQHLSKIKSLELLSIKTNDVTDEGFTYLGQLTNLQDLKLSFCPKITEKGLSKIANMKNLKKLSLTISRPDISEQTYVTISDLACLNALTNLKSLSLTGVIQDDTGLNLNNLKNLESLAITCKVTSMQKRGVSVFPIYQLFTDQDLACLANLKNLRSLLLRGSDSITDKGLMHIQGLTNLENLSLYEASLTDDGLAYLKDMKNLNDLSIGGSFTEYGLQHLKELKALESLYLYPDSAIPNRAVKELKNSLPYLSRFQMLTK